MGPFKKASSDQILEVIMNRFLQKKVICGFSDNPVFDSPNLLCYSCFVGANFFLTRWTLDVKVDLLVIMPKGVSQRRPQVS